MSKPDHSPFDMSFREHGSGKRTHSTSTGTTRGGNRLPMPEGVGYLSQPTGGRRYLYEIENGKQNVVALLVPKEDMEAGIEDELQRRSAKVLHRRPASDAFLEPAPSAPQGKVSDRRAWDAIRQLEWDQLEQKALDRAGVVKLMVDISRLQIPGREAKAKKAELPDLVDWLRGADLDGGNAESSGQGDSATRQTFACLPHHVLTCEEYPEWGPGRPVKRLSNSEFHPVVKGDAGHGLTVAVVDTGGRIDHKLLHRNLPASDALSRGVVDAEDLDQDEDNHIDYVAGHGTFIAGIIRQYAPGAKIVFRSAAHPNGTAPEGLVAGALLSLMEPGSPKIDYINLSLGGYLHNNDDEGLRLTFEALRTLKSKWKDLIVVACAGNNNRDDPFYPAALPDVVGVGALGVDGQKADFSNFGTWVDKWALGENLQSSWVGTSLTTLGGGGPGDDGAVWSGTSFATPMYIAALAAAKSPSRT